MAFPHMIGIVLCAGMGSRLRPLTQLVSKVACPLGNQPFAFTTIAQMFDAGFPQVHVNLHYLAEDVKKELLAACLFHGYDPGRLVFWHEEIILETGGGIARIFHEVWNPSAPPPDVCVVSGDILSPFPWNALWGRWAQRKPHQKALMMSVPLTEARKDLMWTSEDRVVGFGSIYPDIGQITPRIFSNHQIISGEIVAASGRNPISSIPLFYKPILNAGQTILHVPLSDSWYNVGTFEIYRSCVGKAINTFHTIPRTLAHTLQQYCQGGGQMHPQLPMHSGKPLIFSFSQPLKLRTQGYLALSDLFPECQEDVYFFVS